MLDTDGVPPPWRFRLGRTAGEWQKNWENIYFIGKIIWDFTKKILDIIIIIIIYNNGNNHGLPLWKSWGRWDFSITKTWIYHMTEGISIQLYQLWLRVLTQNKIPRKAFMGNVTIKKNILVGGNITIQSRFNLGERGNPILTMMKWNDGGIWTLLISFFRRYNNWTYVHILVEVTQPTVDSNLTSKEWECKQL